MGKSSGKRKIKQTQRAQSSQSAKNVKNLEVNIQRAAGVGGSGSAPGSAAGSAREMTPQTPEEYFDEDDYNPEISMGAASPVVLQNPTLQLIGTPTSGRPMLVEIKRDQAPTNSAETKDCTPLQAREVELSARPMEVDMGPRVPAQSMRRASSGSQSSKSSRTSKKSVFDDLQDEFRTMMDDLETSPEKAHGAPQRAPQSADSTASSPKSSSRGSSNGSSGHAPALPSVPQGVRPVLVETTASPETSPASSASTARSEMTPPKMEREIPTLSVEAPPPELGLAELRKGLKSVKAKAEPKAEQPKEVAAPVETSNEPATPKTPKGERSTPGTPRSVPSTPKTPEEKVAEAREKVAQRAQEKEARLKAEAREKAEQAQRAAEQAAQERFAAQAEAELREAAERKRVREQEQREKAEAELKAKAEQAKEAEEVARKAKAATPSAPTSPTKSIPKVDTIRLVGPSVIADEPEKAPASPVKELNDGAPGLAPEEPAQKPSTPHAASTALSTALPTTAKGYVTSPKKSSSSSPQKAPPQAAPSAPALTSNDDLIVGVAVVGFHHTRGPEVEYWIGPNGNQSALWPYLPFQSLPDGSHSFEETICYFTVLYDPSTGTAPNPTPQKNEEGLIVEQSNFHNVETLFGISCTRQIQASTLTNKDEDVTRSNVQKGLVVLARKPVFGPIKEKLKVVTRTYFDQRDFEDRRIIDNLYENVQHLFSDPQNHSEGDFLVGTNPRELVYKFGPQAMVLFKALLLEKRIAFYASDTERLCGAQFSLVSLIPDLLNNLQDCGSPLLSTYETRLTKPTFLRTSDRSSLLKFLGFPLQVFAAGGMFAPFVPLQLVDELKQPEFQYGVFGSTNKVFFDQGIEYDVLVDVDAFKVTVQPSIRKELELTSEDKTFFNGLFTSVKSTWDDENSEQPTSLGYEGSEDFIRHSFEDYLMGLVSSAKYQQHLEKQHQQPSLFSRGYPSNPLKAFGAAWTTAWKLTNNYRIFNKFTDEELFDIVHPSHFAQLKNKRRTDAIAEVRSVLKSPQPQSPPSMSTKIFGMFGWPSAKTPGSAPASAPSSAPATPVLPSDPSSEPEPSTPSSPRKRFFWS